MSVVPVVVLRSIEVIERVSFKRHPAGRPQAGHSVRLLDVLRTRIYGSNFPSGSHLMARVNDIRGCEPGRMEVKKEGG